MALLLQTATRERAATPAQCDGGALLRELQMRLLMPIRARCWRERLCERAIISRRRATPLSCHACRFSAAFRCVV